MKSIIFIPLLIINLTVLYSQTYQSALIKANHYIQTITPLKVRVKCYVYQNETDTNKSYINETLILRNSSNSYYQFMDTKIFKSLHSEFTVNDKFHEVTYQTYTQDSLRTPIIALDSSQIKFDSIIQTIDNDVTIYEVYSINSSFKFVKLYYSRSTTSIIKVQYYYEQSTTPQEQYPYMTELLYSYEQKLTDADFDLLKQSNYYSVSANKIIPNKRFESYTFTNYESKD